MRVPFPLPLHVAIVGALLSAPCGAVTASSETPANAQTDAAAVKEDGVPESLLQAIAALHEGVTQVAIVKLREQLAHPESLTPASRKLAKTGLAEALLAAGLLEEATRQVRDPEVKDSVLEARIAAASGHWAEALALYEANPDSATNPALALAKAECLNQGARRSEAIAVLEKIQASSSSSPSVQLRLGEYYLEQGQLEKCAALLPGIAPHTISEQKWKQYVEARLLLAQGHAEDAFSRFSDLQKDPRELTENLLAGCALGMAEARIELSGFNPADDILEQFIWKNPENALLDGVFRKLDEVYSCEENPSRGELVKWSQRDPARRAGFAQYYLAKSLLREGKVDRALVSLDNFSERFPNHPLLAEALLMQGQLLTVQRKFTAAQQALDAAMRAGGEKPIRAEIEMASATAHFQAEDFVLAATVFHDVSEHSPAFRERALFNSALAWLHQGNYARFAQDYKSLTLAFPQSSFRCDLILEEGLMQARSANANAEATLKQFIRDFANNARVPEARLALAELHFAKNDTQGAGLYLQAVNSAPAPLETVEQADYLAIFVADSAAHRDEDKVIALCKTFIDRYPTSVRIAEVRMKLGQVYFRRDEFNSAQTQFDKLARESQGSPLVETALFLAGQASIKSMSPGGIDRSLILFDEVAKFNGPLKLHARLQQALAQNRLGKGNEAIILYDVILHENPEGEVKFAALAGKAHTLQEMGAKDNAFYEQALAIYGQLASEPEVTANWRNQALYEKGRCLEALARPNEALAAYYDVVQAGVAKPQEYFWFYKAGFDAGHLCETQNPPQWKSAIGIYQKMSLIDGPRSEEAKARMTQIRLEHFIWE